MIVSTQEAIAAAQKGEMLVVVDNADRENEGDLVICADCVTAESINFMATYGRGLICMPMHKELAETLKLPLMAHENKSSFNTQFTVSIGAKTGITTGISAHDRAHTVKQALEGDPDLLVSPGHLFPLIAHPQGLKGRQGHTEASVTIAQLAGFRPASVICEVMKDDGHMARLDDLQIFAQKHNLKIVQIDQLYRDLYQAS